MEIIASSYKNRKNKNKKAKEKLTKSNFWLLRDSEREIRDKKGEKRSKNNIDDGKQDIKERINSHKSCTNLKQSN